MTPTDLISTIKALLEKATPGILPWHVRREGDFWLVRDDAGVFIARFHGENLARLWAQSPTLLAACVEALECPGCIEAEAEVARLKDQIARMRPGTSGVLDELEAENARLKERVAELEAIPTLNMYRMAQDKRIAELEAKVEELEETVAAGDGNYDDNVKRIATLTAALERARPVVAARVPADQWKYATGWEGQLLDAIDAALSQARDGGEGES